MTKEEMVEYARELAGPDAEVRVVGELDEVVDGVRRRCIAVEAVGHGARSSKHGKTTKPLLVRFATPEDDVEAAKENPSGAALAAGAGLLALLSGGAWVWYRSSERAKLVEMLRASATVQRALDAQLVSWTPEDKAAEVVGYMNTTKSDEGFALVLTELQRLLPVEPGDVVDLSADVLRVVSEKTGVDLEAVKSQVSGYLPSWLIGD